jgi:hypothetical protein
MAKVIDIPATAHATRREAGRAVEALFEQFPMHTYGTALGIAQQPDGTFQVHGKRFAEAQDNA